MFLNNFSFALFWWLLIEKVGSIGGYGYKDVMLLWAIASTAFGLAVTFFGNTLGLVDIIVKGELDSYLLQPKNILINVLMSKSQISGWGDMLYGILLICLLFPFNVPKIGLFLLLSLVSSLLFVSVNVMAASCTFFFGQFKSVADWAVDFLISFSIYPEIIYTGFVRLLLFTALPAGFFTMIPARLLQEFTFSTFLLFVTAVSLWVCFSILFFRLGLKRYESGNLLVQKL
jgi:ABC-2 type transport system permease protein